MVIEYKGKKYSVVGEGDTYYICTYPWDEVEGETFHIPKSEANELDGLRYKMVRYEKALKECIEQNGLLKFLEENEWATQEDYFVKLAKEALY